MTKYRIPSGPAHTLTKGKHVAIAIQPLALVLDAVVLGARSCQWRVFFCAAERTIDSEDGHAIIRKDSVLALDLVIYLQHVMFHAVPLLWRVHRVHHADLGFDVTTGTRFHPSTYWFPSSGLGTRSGSSSFPELMARWNLAAHKSTANRVKRAPPA